MAVVQRERRPVGRKDDSQSARGPLAPFVEQAQLKFTRPTAHRETGANLMRLGNLGGHFNDRFPFRVTACGLSEEGTENGKWDLVFREFLRFLPSLDIRSKPLALIDPESSATHLPGGLPFVIPVAEGI